jgi:hypothetical protein
LYPGSKRFRFPESKHETPSFSTFDFGERLTAIFSLPLRATQKDDDDYDVD